MRFRQDLRSRLPILCGDGHVDPRLALAAAPPKADELDRAISVVGAEVLAGAQFIAFNLRYFGNEDDPDERERMRVAYAVLRGLNGSSEGVTFDALIRNSNRAMERLLDVLGSQSNGRRYKKIILQGWQDAQNNAD